MDTNMFKQIIGKKKPKERFPGRGFTARDFSLVNSIRKARASRIPV